MQVSRLLTQSLARVRLQIERSPDRLPPITARPTPPSHFRRPPAWRPATLWRSEPVDASKRPSS
jgi:hypothetical protein